MQHSSTAKVQDEPEPLSKRLRSGDDLSARIEAAEAIDVLLEACRLAAVALDHTQFADTAICLRAIIAKHEPANPLSIRTEA